MGGKGAAIELHHNISVTSILNIVTKLPAADAGKFYNLGKQNPWYIIGYSLRSCIAIDINPYAVSGSAGSMSSLGFWRIPHPHPS